jgi:hypothetical protein
LGKLPLVQIETVEAVHTQLEGRCHVQEVCSPSRKSFSNSVNAGRACAAETSLRKILNPIALTTSSSPNVVKKRSPEEACIMRAAAAELASGL